MPQALLDLGFDERTLTGPQADWLRQLRPMLARVPDYMHGPTVRYVLFGVRPNEFLQALFANDLIDAVGRADDENLEALWRWIRLLANATPARCRGSRSNLAAWIERGGLGRTDAAMPSEPIDDAAHDVLANAIERELHS